MDSIQFQIPGLTQIQHEIEALKEEVSRLNQRQFRDRWLDNKAFCTHLSISSRTAQNYRDRGLISFSQIGTKIYYKQEDVEIFLEQHKVKAFYSKSA